MPAHARRLPGSDLPLLTKHRLRRLLSLTHREGRRRHRRFLADGLRFVSRALDLRRPLRSLLLCQELIDRPIGILVSRARRLGTPTFNIRPEDYLRLSRSAEPQGVLAEVDLIEEPLSRITADAGSLWLAVSRIRSPGNLGTMLRTGEACGARGLIMLGPEVDPFDPRCVRATMGSIFQQRLVRSHPSELHAWAVAAGYRLLAASPAGTRSLWDCAYDGPLILFMGSERTGLTPEELSLCDDAVRIPMTGGADSLNVAVAAGVLLFEASRSRLSAATESVSERPAAVRRAGK